LGEAIGSVNSFFSKAYTSPGGYEEVALTENDTIFREIAERSPLGIYLIQDKEFRYVNPRLAQMFGYSAEELIGRKAPVDLVLPEDWHIVERNLLKGLSGESKYVCYDFRGRKRDGRTIYIETHGFSTTHQEHPAVAGTLEDITGRMHSEKVLLEQRDFLREIIESVTVPSYVIDARNYSILMANSASGFDGSAGSQFCYALTYNRGKPCGGSGNPCPLEMVKETGKAATVEHVHSDGTGNMNISEIHGYPIFDDKGIVTKMVEYSFDITERKRHEAERERLIIQLQSSVSRIKTLAKLLTICCSCKKIRDGNGYWSEIEDYIMRHSGTEFSHGFCPECARRMYPECCDEGGEEKL
jgi:PAS domain S-box-containing protein